MEGVERFGLIKGVLGYPLTSIPNEFRLLIM